MSTIEKGYWDEVERRRQMFHWFVDGIGQHGISWDMYDHLTPDFVEKCYNYQQPNYNEDLVDAACCIANKNKAWDGSQMFDIDKRFYGWIKVHVKKQLNH